MSKMKYRRFVQPAELIVVTDHGVTKVYVKATHAKHLELNVQVYDRQVNPQMPLEVAMATGAFVPVEGHA